MHKTLAESTKLSMSQHLRNLLAPIPGACPGPVGMDMGGKSLFPGLHLNLCAVRE